MNTLLKIFTILLLLAIVPMESKAQCRDFAKEDGLSKLDTLTYIHDGRYNAIKLREGDEIELFKTISAGIQYRLVVCGSSELPEVPFEVLDFERNVIYSSPGGRSAVWDFSAQSSQRLIISIKLPPSTSATPESGCVAILFGLKKS